MSASELLLIDYFAFGLALFALSAWAVFRHRPALALFAVFCAVYLAVRPIMLLTGVYGRFAGLQSANLAFSEEVLWQVLVFTFAMTALAISAYFLARPGSLERALSRRLAEIAQRPLIVAALWLAALAAFVVSAGFSIGSSLLGVLLFGLLWLIGYAVQSHKPWYWMAAGVMVLGIVLTLTVERRDWAVGIFALGWLLLIDRGRSIVLKSIVGGGLLASVALVAVLLRTEGNVSERLQGGGVGVVLAIVEIELDFPLVFDDLVLLFSKVPDEEPFLYGEVAAKPAFAWIPRAAWPQKPETLSREFSRRFNRPLHAGGGSEPTTFAGELYWNFGWFGLAFAPGLGWLLAALDRSYVIGRAWRALDPLRGTAIAAGSLVLASMSFYVLRGPIDTFWIHYLLFVVVLALVLAFPRTRAAELPVYRVI